MRQLGARGQELGTMSHKDWEVGNAKFKNLIG